MHLFQKKVLIVITIFSFNKISAQSNSITLPQALQMAEDNYPGIKAKQAELNGSISKISSAKTEFLPSLILQDQYQYSTNNGLTGSFYPNEGMAIPTSGGIRDHNIYQPIWGSFTTLFVDWKFFTFGKVRAGVNLSRQEMNKANADYKNEVFQHKIKVADTYMLLLMAQKLTEAQENNIKRAEAFRQAVNAYAVSGLRPGADTSYANAEYAKAQISLTQSKQYERSLRLSLAELIGNSNSDIIADTTNFYNRLPLHSSIDTTKISSHPVLKLFQSQIDISLIRTQTIQRSYFPSFSLLATGWGRGSGVSNKDDSYRTDIGSGISYQAYNYLMGVSFKWNLLSYSKVHFDTEAERMQTQRFKFLYDEQALKIRRQIEDAEIQFNTATEQAKLAPVELSSASASYHQSEARYISGLATFPELTQSFYILNRAETDMAIAYSNVWRSLFLKAAAAGDINILLNAVQSK